MWELRAPDGGSPKRSGWGGQNPKCARSSLAPRRPTPTAFQPSARQTLLPFPANTPIKVSSLHMSLCLSPSLLRLSVRCSASSPAVALPLRFYASSSSSPSPALPPPVKLPFELAQPPASDSPAEGEAFVITHGLLFVPARTCFMLKHVLRADCRSRTFLVVRSGSKQKYVSLPIVC